MLQKALGEMLWLVQCSQAHCVPSVLKHQQKEAVVSWAPFRSWAGFEPLAYAF